MHGRLAEANLAALFPGTSPEHIDRIRRAADRLGLDSWGWWEDHVSPPASGPDHRSLLGCTIYPGADEDDQVELNLHIYRASDTAGVEVVVDLGVWCWCPQDHNIHYVRDVEVVATSPEELVTAFESAVAQFEHWRDTASTDAEGWRAEAGLPLRRR